jgi:hypothetical protein
MSEAMPGTSREKSHGPAARCLSNKLVLGGSGGNSNDFLNKYIYILISVEEKNRNHSIRLQSRTISRKLANI